MTETARGPTLRAYVQTSPDLAVWTSRPSLVVEEYSEGQTEIVGSATFRHDWGAIAAPGADVATVADLGDLGGLYCRILRENLTGAITVDTLKWDAVWHGVMLSPDSATSGGNGTTTYQASGIAAVLNSRSCWVGRCLVKSSPAGYAVAFNLAPFNHWPSGDRSTAAVVIGDPYAAAVYVHDATKTDTGNQWTASQIISYLFACNFRYEHPPSISGSGQLGLNWALEDPDGCLAWIPERYDARGKTLTQVLNELAGHKRGLVWYVTVSSTTLTINVKSALATALTVGVDTIPANAAVWDQLDATDPFIHPVTIASVSDEVADEITVRGSSRRIGITLAIYGTGTPFVSAAASQLVKGWTDTAEAAANTALDNGVVTRRTAYEHAWRRFALRAEDWSGAAYSSGGMPDALTTATDASYGTAGYSGVASRTGLSTLAGLWYSAEGDLPCAAGFTAVNVGPRQPLVIVAEDDTAGTWVDHSTNWTVQVESSPPAVIIDDGANGTTLRDILRAGRKVLVSLTLVDFLPFQVMWRRNPAEWIAVPPRTKLIEMPDLGQEYLLSGMVTGVDADAGGNLLTTSSQITTKDNVVQLRRLLAQARAWYEEPYQRATFTDRGVWDVDPAYGPGTILGVITDGVTEREINASVTRRSFRCESIQSDNGSTVRYWSTTFETDVIYPDMEAVL